MAADRLDLPVTVAVALAVGAVLAVLRATPAAPPHLAPPVPLCGAEDVDRLVVGRCTAPGHAAAEPERVRAAMGRPLCWHTADAAGFATVSGVGPALAERIVAARDAGVPPDPTSLQAVRGIGPALARRVATAVTDHCPRVPTPHRPTPRDRRVRPASPRFRLHRTPYRAATRPGLRRTHRVQ